MDLEAEISKVLNREGRTYENVPHDRGGPTKFGITLSRLKTERGRATWQDVRDLTEEDARGIYRTAYFTRPGISRLPASIQPFVFDWYVTSGAWAIAYLGRILGDLGFQIPRNSPVNDAFVEAVFAAEEGMGDDLLRALIVERAHFFQRIVANDETQKKFLRGWINQRCRPFWKELN